MKNSITQKMKYKQSVIKFSFKYGVTKTAVRFDINRRTIYRWIAQYDGTIESLRDKSRKPKHHPNEHSAFEIEKENRSLKYQIEEKDKEIYNLKGELSTKDKIIGKLWEEKESIKAQLYKFKEFWHSIMGHFHKRICYDKDNNYKIVSDDLYKNGIFTDDENEIANNIARKVKPKDEMNKDNNNRKKYDTRF